jgi:hypothetical protein
MFVVSIHQTIVWIDDNEARILRVEAGLHPELTIHSPDPPDVSEQATCNEETTNNVNVSFRQVARALDTADEIPVVRPSATKAEFVQSRLIRCATPHSHMRGISKPAIAVHIERWHCGQSDWLRHVNFDPVPVAESDRRVCRRAVSVAIVRSVKSGTVFVSA